MVVEDREAIDPKGAVMYPEFSGVLVSGATKVRVGVRVEGEGEFKGRVKAYGNITVPKNRFSQD